MSTRGIKNYFKVGICTTDQKAVTSIADLITVLKSAGNCLLSTGGTYIGAASPLLANIGLAKAATLSYAVDGDEDNNGDTGVKFSFACKVVGIEQDKDILPVPTAPADPIAVGVATVYDALVAICTGRKYVILFDESTGLFKQCGLMKIDFTDKTEGNAIEEINITGEETGALSSLFTRRFLPAVDPTP